MKNLKIHIINKLLQWKFSASLAIVASNMTLRRTLHGQAYAGFSTTQSGFSTSADSGKYPSWLFETKSSSACAIRFKAWTCSKITKQMEMFCSSIHFCTRRKCLSRVSPWRYYLHFYKWLHFSMSLLCVCKLTFLTEYQNDSNQMPPLKVCLVHTGCYQPWRSHFLFSFMLLSNDLSYIVNGSTIMLNTNVQNMFCSFTEK